eukprot:911765_1
MSRGKSVHKRIKLSSEINSIDFWYKHYYNEYEDSHVNPNQSFINSNQDLTDLYTQSTIDCIISEQCLLALTDNKPVVDASCEWLKYHDCYVYNRIRYKSQLNHGDAQSVLEIVAKIRMIFKHNLTNIAVSNDKLFKIPNLYIELKYNFQRQQDHWTRVRLFRSQYNVTINNNNELLNNIQIGLHPVNRRNYRMDALNSILTYYAILRHNNINRCKAFKNKDQTFKKIIKQCMPSNRTGLGGSYTVSAIFKQISIVSRYQIFMDKFKSIGNEFYAMLPQCVRTVCGSLMCGATIRKYINVIQIWYTSMINTVILPSNTGLWPVVNASLDAATFKGNWALKVIPIELTTYYAKYKLGFRWCEIYQPVNPTKETGIDLQIKLNTFTDKYPAIRKLNAVAMDNGSTETKHIALQRETNKLLLCILDASHLYNTIIKTGIQETWGYTNVKTKVGTIRKATVPHYIKETSKTIQKTPIMQGQMVQYYKVNQYRTTKGSSETRFAGNIDASSSFITKKRVDTITNALNEPKETDESIAKQDDDLQEDDSWEYSEFNDLIEALPEISDDSDYTASFEYIQKRCRSKFKSKHKNRDKVYDEPLYHQELHSKQYIQKNQEFDLKKIVLILQVLVSNKDVDRRLIDFWRKRMNHGAIVTIHCLGDLVIKPVLELNGLHRNRVIELYPMTAHNFEKLHQIRKALQYLIRLYDQKDIESAVNYILDETHFHWRVKCAVMYRHSDTFKWCNNDKKGAKQFPCDECIRDHKCAKLNALSKILPPKNCGYNLRFIRKLFKNIIALKNDYDDTECKRIIIEYLGDIFALTTSDWFSKWDEIDNLTTLQAKCAVYVQALRFTEIIYYKYIERWSHMLEGGYCIYPLLRNPEISIIVANNILEIGHKQWQQRTSSHLGIKPWELAPILEMEVKNGYNGGVKYLHHSIWRLIEKLATMTDPQSLETCDELVALLEFVDIHCIVYNNTIYIESMNKPIKDMCGQQKISPKNINRTFWYQFNMKNACFLHPIHFYYLSNQSNQNAYKLPFIAIPEADSEYCQTFALPSQMEIDTICNAMNKEPYSYTRATSDPSQALGLVYKPTDDVENISNLLNNPKNTKSTLPMPKARSTSLQTRTISQAKLTSDRPFKKQKRHGANPQNTFKVWRLLTEQNQQALRKSINSSEDVIIQRSWDKLINNDMIDGIIIESVYTLAHRQNCRLDLGFCKDKINSKYIRILKPGGCHIVYCDPFKHYILIHYDDDTGNIYIHDSLFNLSNITPIVKQTIIQLAANIKPIPTQTLDVNIIEGQQQVPGGLNCAIYCIAKLTELLCCNIGISPIKFDESRMRSHLAHCLLNNKLIPFPKLHCNEHYIIHPLNIRLICTCKQPASIDNRTKTCIECKIEYHWKCIRNMIHKWNYNTCHLCVSNLNHTLYPLMNLGNTCWTKAAIQTVLNTRPIYKYYENIALSDSNPISKALAALVQNKDKDMKALRESLKLDTILKQYLEWINHDVSDFLNDYLSKLDDTIVSSTFQGLQQSTIQCEEMNCGYTSHKLQQFISLALPIKWHCTYKGISFDQIALNVTQCLEHYHQKEYIELYRCPDCQKQMIFKTISCIEWPQFLILTLNRWGSSDTDKLEYLIDSPQLLTIDRSTNVRYQLYCVVNHTVDPNHYTVNVLNDRSWFRINDDVISICMEQQIITKNAYILCYQKIDNDEL